MRRRSAPVWLVGPGGVATSVCEAVRAGVAVRVGVDARVGVDYGVKLGVIEGMAVGVVVQTAAIAVNDMEVMIACCSTPGLHEIRTRTIIKSIR